jgi:hypothetical protein
MNAQKLAKRLNYINHFNKITEIIPKTCVEEVGENKIISNITNLNATYITNRFNEKYGYIKDLNSEPDPEPLHRFI